MSARCTFEQLSELIAQLRADVRETLPIAKELAAQCSTIMNRMAPDPVEQVAVADILSNDSST